VEGIESYAAKTLHLLHISFYEKNSANTATRCLKIMVLYMPIQRYEIDGIINDIVALDDEERALWIFQPFLQ